MQARDQIALDHERVVFGAPDRGVRMLLVEHDLVILEPAAAGASRGPLREPMAIGGIMLVTSSVAQSTS